LSIIQLTMLSQILGLILVVPLVISVSLGLYSWRRRAIPGATYLAGCMLGSAVVASCYAMELISPSLEAKFFWHSGYYLGAIINLSFLFQFSWWYTHRYSTPNRIIPALLFAVGLLIMASYATNDFHHRFFSSISLNKSGPFTFLIKTNGVLYWLTIAWTYLIVFGAIGLLYGSLKRLELVNRKQALVMLSGLAAPVIANLVYLMNFRPWGFFNFTAYSYTVTGLAIGWGIFRYRLLDPLPYARDLILERFPFGLIVMDTQGNIADINAVAQSDFGVSGRQVVGQPVERLSKQYQDFLNHLMQDPLPLVEERTLDISGRERIFQFEVVELKEAGFRQGRVIILRDITIRRQEEEELRQSEAHLRFVTENVSDALFLLDPDFRFTYVSPAMEGFLGYTVDEIIQLPVEAYLSPESVERMESILKDFKNDLVSEKMSEHKGKPDVLELEYCGKDGIERWGEVSFSFFANQEGKLTGGIGVIRDITDRRLYERRRLEQERHAVVLEEREKLARELHDGVGQVMGYASAQTQAALEYINSDQIGLAQAILARLTEVEQAAHADIRALILGMNEDTSRYDTGIDIYSILRSYCTQFTRVYGLPVIVSLPADPIYESSTPRGTWEPSVEINLLRIIQEALTNVRKHANASQAQVTVLERDKELEVIIADDGVGFNFEKIQTPGSLSPDSVITEGSEEERHFGLKIMQSRAMDSNGNLEIRSTPGEGTQIIVHFPLQRSIPQASLVTMRVLLVDDQPLFREGLRNLLAARGMQVVGEAGDGVQAVELAHKLRPDMVLMDCQMPNMDGVEATRLIYTDMPETRIVMLTVAEDEKTLFQAIRNGASGYLLKDLKPAEFFGMLETLARGETPLSPSLTTRMLSDSARIQGDTTDVQLSPRQRKILDLVACGMTNKEIGVSLHLSESAIKYHVGQIFEELHVRSRDEALAIAAQRGWLERRR
jgi:PAS domain S-box-containing protein